MNNTLTLFKSHLELLLSKNLTSHGKLTSIILKAHDLNLSIPSLGNETNIETYINKLISLC